MIDEARPPFPNLLFITLVDNEKGTHYVVATTLQDRHAYLYSRFIEDEMGIEPTHNVGGRFFTQAIELKPTGDQVGELPMMTPENIITIKRSMFGREAVMTHDKLVEELEQDTYDFVNDPYYQVDQVAKFEQELDDLDINKLRDELKELDNDA